MSKKNNVVALTAQSSVPDAINKINQRIAALKHIQDSVYKTSGKITMSGGQKDIKTETSVLALVTAFSSVQARMEALEKAYKALGISSYPVVKIDGSTVDEWKDDINLRIQIIEQKETLDELNTYKKEWEELMDKEDRKILLLEKMAKFADN